MRTVLVRKESLKNKMKYHEVFQHIKTGDLLAAHGKWMASQLIQWYTGHPISHVGVACWINFNGGPRTLCMFEAMEGYDVRIVPVEKVLRTKYWTGGSKMYHKRLKNPYVGKELMSFCQEHWNDAYANHYQFILGISPKLQYIRSILGRSLDTDHTKMHCSELIAAGLREQNYEWNKELALVTPGEVFDADCWTEHATELCYSSTKQVRDSTVPLEGR
jgi:hypothetical protein